MPLYYFDIFDRVVTRDDIGQDCVDHVEAQRIAFKSLPEIAADELTADGNKRNFAVVVRDSAGQPIYTAMLSYAGQSLV